MLKRYTSRLLGACAVALLSVAVAAAAAVAGPANPDVKPLGSTPSGFGFANLEALFSQAPPPASPPGTLGPPDTQAGSHPFAITIEFELNKGLIGETPVPLGGEARKVAVNLPPGLIGDPTAVPQCTRPQLDDIKTGCPAATQIGILKVGVGGTGTGLSELEPALYNMVPPPGAPAQFAFNLLGAHVFLDAGVRTGSDNGVTEHADNLSQRSVILTRATVWGVPSEHLASAEEKKLHEEKKLAWKAFLTLPTSCGDSLKVTAEADTWEEPNVFATALPFEAPAMTGCERLSFGPSIGIAPDTNVADSPAGLSVDVRVPQGEELTDPNRLVASNIKDVKVVLPTGVTVNPGRASGLTACQPSQDGVGSEGPVSCPASSRIGSVEVDTPLLRDRLQGGVYVLQSNPPNIRVLLAPSGDGVNPKLVGDVHLDEATGQVITTFSETPDLPFTDLRMFVDGGPQGALVTPSACGPYSINTDFTPWATPYVQDALSENTFSVEAGAEGTPCGSQQPFAPSMVAGTTNNQADGFSPFSVTLSRRDQDEGLAQVSVQTPPGLLGLLKNVEQCGEPQAGVGECSSASEIGHTTVAAGPGAEPLYVQGGQVFLTGPYRGAPFGLSIVVPAVAGPFTLAGNGGPGREIVRAGIYVDPHTAQVTVVSDPLPRILDGVPLQLKKIYVTIDREGFIFNPTNCEALMAAGTLTSAQGAVAPVSSRFQAANCATLPFDPKFSASTAGRASKADGASLDVKVASKGGPQSGGGEANIRSVRVELPKKLPSRLKTLQKACLASTFDANPANCSKESDVGTATASTPVLAHPLSGPAYLVSHGGAAFPDLEIVLQGEGITLVLDGQTRIKKGITSSTFATVPDAPISSFELRLPAGSYSVLGTNLPAKAKYSFCKQTLAMPTTITGQNGAVIRQTTKIAVVGCRRPKAGGRPRRSEVGHNPS